MQELMKSQIVMQQQGNKNAQTGSHVKLHGSMLTKGTPSNLDEFKYGFPSDGLSSVSYRWWGDSSTNGSMSTEGNEIQDKKKSPTNLVDSDVLSSMNGGDKCEKITDKSDIDSSVTGSLTALRKKGVKEGQEALKLGGHRRHGINKLDQTKNNVLMHCARNIPSRSTLAYCIISDRMEALTYRNNPYLSQYNCGAKPGAKRCCRRGPRTRLPAFGKCEDKPQKID